MVQPCDLSQKIMEPKFYLNLILASGPLSSLITDFGFVSKGNIVSEIL